jgi:hypothetical protein
MVCFFHQKKHFYLIFITLFPVVPTKANYFNRSFQSKKKGTQMFSENYSDSHFRRLQKALFRGTFSRDNFSRQFFATNFRDKISRQIFAELFRHENRSTENRCNSEGGMPHSKIRFFRCVTDTLIRVTPLHMYVHMHNNWKSSIVWARHVGRRRLNRTDPNFVSIYFSTKN